MIQIRMTKEPERSKSKPVGPQLSRFIWPLNFGFPSAFVIRASSLSPTSSRRRLLGSASFHTAFTLLHRATSLELPMAFGDFLLATALIPKTDPKRPGGLHNVAVERHGSQTANRVGDLH